MDIDLTFSGYNLTLDVIHKIEEKIEGLNLHYIFDNSIYERIDNKNLIEHINRVGKSFYESNRV